MLFLDSHPQPMLHSVYDVLEGWAAVTSDLGLSFRLGDAPLATQFFSRPDLGAGGLGFRCYVDLTKLGPSRSGDPLPLQLWSNEGVLAQLPLDVLPSLAEAIAGARNAKLRKRNWLENNLAHWSTGERGQLDSDWLFFPGAETRIPQSGFAAINALDPSYGFSGRLLDKSDGVSAHPYPTRFEAVLAQETREDFMALDFGAGFKKIDHPNIIFMEIFDYPSTDILAVGQSLPFADNSFDLVVTLAVLEHVDDPFACAREIARVTKPGGLVFSGIPFMQPEHGYPDHYFNATRSGHRRLYSDAFDIVEQYVDDHQHPMLSLQWALRSYMLGLPEAARTELGSMTLEQFLGLRYWRSRSEAFVAGLSEHAEWELASATTLIGRKKAG